MCFVSLIFWTPFLMSFSLSSLDADTKDWKKTVKFPETISYNHITIMKK